MNNKILGFKSDTFYALILLLLLVILGIVSFNYYVRFSGKNGIDFGTGFGVKIGGNYKPEDEGFM